MASELTDGELDEISDRTLSRKVVYAIRELKERRERERALREALTSALNIGDILIEAAERDGDMSDEEVSGCRGRAAEVFAQLRTLLHPTEVSR